MWIFYDLIFLLISIFYLPIYLFKRKFHAGFLLRLGFLPEDLTLDRPIWVHAVSLGEAIAAKGLIEEIRKTYPHKRLVISTVTTTGNKIAQGIAKEGDFVTYLPLDFSFIVRRVIDRVNPEIFILMETELWPNLIIYLKRRNIPSLVVNARISDASFKGYKSIRFFLKYILRQVSFFCAQAQTDAQRLIALGAPFSNVRTTGNMKFDSADYTDKIIDNTDDTDCRLKLSLQSQHKLFVAGSTHPGEEEKILEVYKKLLARFTDLRLLIAPRHPKRAQDIASIASKYGFDPVMVSGLAGKPVSQLAGEPVSGLNPLTGQPAHRLTVFILDTIGELVSYYAIADIVFVGGSLIKKGGHNILEPASFGKPVLFGPYMHNFRDIAKLFLENQAAIMVYNKQELEKAAIDLLASSDKINQISKRAKALVAQNQGAAKRNLTALMSLIKD